MTLMKKPLLPVFERNTSSVTPSTVFSAELVTRTLHGKPPNNPKLNHQETPREPSPPIPAPGKKPRKLYTRSDQTGQRKLMQKLQQELGISQRKLAEIVGTKQHTIFRIESGESKSSKISSTHIRDGLERYFGLPFGELIEPF